MKRLCLWAALALAGCHTPGTSQDGGLPDAASDSGLLDAGPNDAGSNDAGPSDAGLHRVPVGSPCTEDGECIPDDDGGIAVCLQGGPYPGGYCSEFCSAHIGNDCGLEPPNFEGDNCTAYLYGPDGGLFPDCYQACLYSPDAGTFCTRPGYICGEYAAGNVSLGPTLAPSCLAYCQTNTDCAAPGGPAGVCVPGAMTPSGDTITDGGVCVPSCTANEQCYAANFCHLDAGDPLVGQCTQAPITTPEGASGSATLVESDLGQPWFIISSGEDLYFTENWPGNYIAAATTSGGPVDNIWSNFRPGSPGPAAGTFATDGTNLYITEPNGKVVIQLAVDHVDGGFKGGTITTLASTPFAPDGIAIDSTDVYWITEGTHTNRAPGNGAVFGTTINGGHIASLAGDQDTPQAVATDGTHLFWVDFGAFVRAAGTDAGFAYSDNGSLVQLDLTGNTVTTLASGQLDPSAVATDGTSVYWIESGPLQYAPDLGYFLNPPSSGTVLQQAIGGSTVITLASQQDQPAWLLVADNHVFWINIGSGYGGVQGEEYVGAGAVCEATPGQAGSGAVIADGLVGAAGLTYTGGYLYFVTQDTAFLNGDLWGFKVP